MAAPMDRGISVVVVLAALLVAAGCGGDEGSPPVTTAVETTVETSPPPPAPAPTPAQPKTVVLVVEQGRPRGGIQRPRLEQGAKIVLVIRSDLGEAVHVHGYDIDRPIRPGTPLRIPLTLTIAGRFEVELHDPDALLAVLEVQP
jgi:hypothetical protein